MSRAADDLAPAIPPRVAFAAARVALAPWAWVTAPRFFGLDNVPMERPSLLVGNHALFAPIETQHLQDLSGNVRICRTLREQVGASIEAGIAFLQCRRERDPRRALRSRIAHDVRGAVSSRALHP